MNKAYKYRIYPTLEQQVLLRKTFGCVRFIYNKMLADKIKYYESDNKMLYNYPSQYKSESSTVKELSKKNRRIDGVSARMLGRKRPSNAKLPLQGNPKW